MDYFWIKILIKKLKKQETREALPFLKYVGEVQIFNNIGSKVIFLHVLILLSEGTKQEIIWQVQRRIRGKQYICADGGENKKNHRT